MENCAEHSGRERVVGFATYNPSAYRKQEQSYAEADEHQIHGG